MGARIATKYKGKCFECDAEWKEKDMIYYDGNKKNKRGKSVVCSNYECFADQGGKLDPDVKVNNTTEDLLFSPPLKQDDVTNDRLDMIDKVLDTIVIRAHQKVEKLYPKLDRKSNTFGMIRNAFIDHYKDLYIARNK